MGWAVGVPGKSAQPNPVSFFSPFQISGDQEAQIVAGLLPSGERVRLFS